MERMTASVDSVPPLTKDYIPADPNYCYTSRDAATAGFHPVPYQTPSLSQTIPYSSCDYSTDAYYSAGTSYNSEYSSHVANCYNHRHNASLYSKSILIRLKLYITYILYKI